MSFNVSDHYWIVNGSATHVYSSKAGDYVPVSDPTYLTWRTIPGNSPTTFTGTEAELGAVLSDNSLRPAPAAVLDGYTDEQAKKLTVAVIAKVLFWLVNQVRTLKGEATLTAPQFKAFLKGLM